MEYYTRKTRVNLNNIWGEDTHNLCVLTIDYQYTFRNGNTTLYLWATVVTQINRRQSNKQPSCIGSGWDLLRCVILCTSHPVLWRHIDTVLCVAIFWICSYQFPAVQGFRCRHIIIQGCRLGIKVCIHLLYWNEYNVISQNSVLCLI